MKVITVEKNAKLQNSPQKTATAVPTLMRRSMSASTLDMVILCMTMSMTRRSRVCHFCRADLEKLLVLAATPVVPRPAGLRCSFFLLLGRGEESGERL